MGNTNAKVAPVTDDEVLALFELDAIRGRVLTAADVAWWLHAERGGSNMDYNPAARMGKLLAPAGTPHEYRPPVRDSHVKPVLVRLVSEGKLVMALGWQDAKEIGDITGTTVARTGSTYYAEARQVAARRAEVARARELAEQGRSLVGRAAAALGERVTRVTTTDGGAAVALVLSPEQCEALLAALGVAAPDAAVGATSGAGQALAG